MIKTTHSDQLELFDLVEPPGQPRPPRLGVFRLQVRYDQVLIGGIVALIGLTVVFALGVERGKQLARAERTWPLRRDLPSSAAERSMAPAVQADAVLPSKRALEEQPVDGPQAEPVPLSPKQPVGRPSRYAVQVVTYHRPQLAQQELRRLQEAGEPAFLTQQQGLTVLYVGPFPSKALAREKRSMLKGRYGDCFVRSL